MATYGITAVRLDATGQITHARMLRADGATQNWFPQPGEVESHEVANSIAVGEDVYSLFIVPDGTALGPKFRQVAYADGTEGVELEVNLPGRRIQDLMTF